MVNEQETPETEQLNQKQFVIAKPVVERLKQELHEFADEQYERGMATGMDWVAREENGADAGALRRLSHQFDEGDCFFCGSACSAFTDAERLMFLMYPEVAGCRCCAQTFWSQLTEDTCDTDFVAGFAEGALSAWDEVQAQM